MIEIYLIKNTVTGKFSSGGTRPTWTKKGKMWTSERNLTLHLSNITNGFKHYPIQYHDAIIIRLKDGNEQEYMSVYKYVEERIKQAELMAPNVLIEGKHFEWMNFLPTISNDIVLERSHNPKINSIVYCYDDQQRVLYPALIIGGCYYNGTGHMENLWEWERLNDQLNRTTRHTGIGRFFKPHKKYSVEVRYVISERK